MYPEETGLLNTVAVDLNAQPRMIWQNPEDDDRRTGMELIAYHAAEREFSNGGFHGFLRMLLRPVDRGGFARA